MKAIQKHIALLIFGFVWLLPHHGAAQESCEPNYSVPYQTINGVAATGSMSNNQFNTMMTVGQPFNTTATNYSVHSAAKGFWSIYLKEPRPPIVRASDGDFQDMVLIEWTVEDDRTGPPVTGDQVTLYRNGYVFATLPVTQTQYQDLNVFPGQYYTYGVTSTNDMGESHTEDNIGFLNPNGVITGRVKTSSGNPVFEAKVTLSPNLGQSAFFDGVSYIYFFDANTSANRLFSGLEGDYTIETWFRSVHTEQQTIFAAVDSATADHYVLLELTEEGKVRWQHSPTAGGSWSEIVTVNSYTEDSEWHHLAVVFDSNDMTMYVDGAIVGHTTASGPVDDTVEIILGKRSPLEPTLFFKGRLDDFRIWSVARTWADVRKYMDLTLSGEESGLAAYWKFDEAEGDIIFDLTANDNDGTICGVAHDDYTAPVYVGALSDSVGNYAIKGIYYAGGITFTVTPSLEAPIGRSLDFDGDDYIGFEAQRIDLTGGYTLEGWFKTSAQAEQTLFAAVDPSDDSHRVKVKMTQEGKVVAAHYGTVITSEAPYNDELWHHYAITCDNEVLALYVDGDPVGTMAVTEAVPDLSEPVIGRSSPEGAEEYFNGLLDEIRLWDQARTYEQIGGTRNQTLEGDEYGLMHYWRLNDGTGDLATDAVGLVTGTVYGAQWAMDIPLNETFVHFFEPESRQATLNNSNTSVDMVDFTDISMIPVSGYVRYENTACFQEGVEILVNGESLLPPIFTDADGKFIIELEPASTGDMISARYLDHEFVPPLIELPMIVQPIAGLYFEDKTTRKVTGYVAGGSPKFPITPSQGQIEVTFRSVNGCIEETVVPDEGSGYFESPDLPPLIYNVSVDHPDPDIDAYFTADTLSLENRDREMDFIYRAPPEVAFVELPESEVACPDFPLVLKQRQVYQVGFHMYEPYGENKASIQSFDLEVFDNISDTTYSTHLEGSETPYLMFTGKKVNLLAGGDHPYQRNIQIVVTDTLGRSADTELWAFIIGDEKIPGVDFSTTTSKMPWWVLRVPPGDGSATYMTTDQTLSRTTRFSNTHTTAAELNNTIHAGTKITTFVGAGLGAFAGVITTSEVIMDIGANFHFTQTWTDINEVLNSLTTSETYTTSGDGLITGDEATVFIGGGYTVDMGIAKSLSLDENCEVVIDTVLTVNPTGVHSTYIHSKYFIKNHLMPDLWMQYTVNGDEDALKDYQYWQEILDKDSIAVATAVPSELLQIGEEGEKASNISFDAGADLEYHYTREHTSSDVSTTIFTDMEQLYLREGFEAFGVGFEFNQVFTHTGTDETTVSTDETKTQTVGFILSDDDPGDGFAFAVKRDPFWDMPVFELIGGQSSSPWEEGTLRRQLADISVTPSLQVDVPPDEPAVFTLLLGNTSETGEDNYYTLSLLAETNPGGAGLRASGGGPIFGIDYFIPAGQVVEVPLYVTRGPEAYNYDNMVLQLAPPSENEIGVTLGAAPQNAAWAEVSVHFQQPCSESHIASPEDGWLITAADETDTLWVTVDGYTFPPDTFLTSIDLQYRPAGGGDWFTAYSVPADSLVDDYVLMPFNISPDIILDGEYELRAQARCTAGKYPGTSQVVTGRIDRTPPQVLGLPEPVDGILGPDDLIRVTLNEEVACGEISPGAGDILLYNTVTGHPMDYTFTCGGNVITFEPNVENRFIENQTFRAEIHNLRDIYGNQRDEPIIWEFFINRNPIEWVGTDISDIVIRVDEEYSTTRPLVNNGGSNRSWEIIGGREGAIPTGDPLFIPSWLEVSPTSGTLTPGSSQDVTISLAEGLDFGEYTTTIYAAGVKGDEPLGVDIRKLCYEPQWAFDPADYQYTMTITATLSTDGELSEDTYDVVGVFVGEELRGVKSVKYMPELEDLPNTHPYEVFLTVYSNVTSGEALSFRVWDASECRELGMVEEDYVFEANVTYGTPTSPATITATSQIISSIPFPAGWTWFSLNLEGSDMSANAVLTTLEPQSGDLIKSQTAFDQYVPNVGWLGTLDTLSHKTMYLIRLSDPDTLEMIGYAVDVETDTVSIVSGWNWIGYSPQQSMDVDYALSSLEAAATGDLIKSQFEYAQFVEGIGWLGSLEFMTPKLGYLLYSLHPGELLYPFYEASPVAKATAPILAEHAAGWSVNPAEYQYTMTLTGIIEVDGAEVDTTADVLAAFVGGECRGVAQPLYIPEMDRFLTFLMIYSNRSEGERIRFRLFDASEGVERTIAEGVEFRSNAMLGTVGAPFALEARPLGIGDVGYVPERFMLGQSFPNPFNFTTRIGYGLPADGQVEIVIYNLLGQKVRTLVSGVQPAGYRFVAWDGRDDSGNGVSTGMYLYIMKAGEFHDMKKLVLLK